MKPRYITFDGADGCGKTTQLEKLKEKLTNAKVPVYHTRALGGDGTCDFQQAIRKVLLNKKFPSDMPMVFEEQLFSMADNEGAKASIKFLQENAEGMVLKDRGLASHVIYSQARGMPVEDIAAVHGKLFNTERELSRHLGALHLVFVPDDVAFTMERIKARAVATGTEVIERLENAPFQQKVMEGMKQFWLHPLAKNFNIEVIVVSKEDGIEAVHDKVLTVLAKHGIAV